MVEFFNFSLVLFLVLANGFFVASEFALVGVRRSRIAALAEEGDRRAKRLLTLLDNLNAYISATQLGITLASLALGWIGEPAVAQVLERLLQRTLPQALLHTLAFVIAFTIITVLHIVIGELAPKTIALERAEKTALAIALPMYVFYRIFAWPIKVLDWAGTRTVRMMGLRPSGMHASIYTEDELRKLIEISHTSGILKQEDRKLLDAVFDFSRKLVRDAMIPRMSVSALEVTSTLDQTKAAFRDSGYSRLPVFRGRVDDIVGVMHWKDLESFIETSQAPEFNLEKLVHPAQFISTMTPLGTALKGMQASRAHLAIVSDEHGSMKGIITIEDLLEEIVGEIYDEFDEVREPSIIKQPDGIYSVRGMLSIRDLNRQLSVELPEHEGYATLGGFMLARAGGLLEVGQSIEYQGITFVVRALDGRRVRRVNIVLPRDPKGAALTSL